MQKPFFIMEDLHRLVETYRSYNKMGEEMVDMLEAESELFLKAYRKREHYNDVVMDVVDNVENQIWELCLVQQSRLPGQNSEELARWSKHNNGVDPMPGFVPPPDHAEDDCFSHTPSLSTSSQSQDSIVVAISEEDAVKSLTKELVKIPTPIKERWEVRQVANIVANTATITNTVATQPSIVGLTSQVQQPPPSTDSGSGHSFKEAEGQKKNSGGSTPGSDCQNMDDLASSEQDNRNGDGGGGSHNPNGGGGSGPNNRDDNDPHDEDGDQDDDSEESLDPEAEDDNDEEASPPLTPEVKLARLKVKSCKEEINMMLSRLKSITPTKVMKPQVVAVIKLQLADVKECANRELQELCDRLCELDPWHLKSHAVNAKKFKKDAKARIMDLEVKIVEVNSQEVAVDQSQAAARDPSSVNTSHLP